MSFLQDFFKRYMPTVKAEDEEVVDPQKLLRVKCSKRSCAELETRLDTCNNRVNSKTKTEETCMEELIDYVECIDHCVAKKLFLRLV